MNNPLIVIYLLVVFAILAIIQIGIRQDKGPPSTRQESGQESEGYTPLAKKLEQVAEESRKAEIRVKEASIDPEYESMILIPAGEFTMGSLEGPKDQEPVRKVYLDAFYIDKYEVTFAPFYEFVKFTGHKKPRLAGYLSSSVTEALPLFIKPFSPVVGVKWFGARDYCDWKGKRLPTEAEWEKAARGEDERKWPWGNEERAEYANLMEDEDGAPYTTAVDQFSRDVSPYGVYGMAGNVMEWVSDWYDQHAYEVLTARNPVGSKFALHRVIRGASWHDSIKRAGTSVRFNMYPAYRDVTIGFRCAKSA